MQCFYTGSGHPALLVYPATAVPHPAGSTRVCHTPVADCGCMAAMMMKRWPARIVSGGPVTHCPWPEGSGPGCVEDLAH